MGHVATTSRQMWRHLNCNLTSAEHQVQRNAINVEILYLVRMTSSNPGRPIILAYSLIKQTKERSTTTRKYRKRVVKIKFMFVVNNNNNNNSNINNNNNNAIVQSEMSSEAPKGQELTSARGRRKRRVGGRDGWRKSASFIGQRRERGRAE